MKLHQILLFLNIKGHRITASAWVCFASPKLAHVGRRLWALAERYPQSASGGNNTMKIPAEIKEMINEKVRSPRIHFATSNKDGKPNVIPVGFVEVISDNEILIIDTLFN